MQAVYNHTSAIIIVALLLVIILLKECKLNCQPCPELQAKTLIETQIDTVWADPELVVLPGKEAYTPITMAASGSVARDTAINWYIDSSKTADLTLFYTAKVRGQLLGLEHSYSLNVPKTIVKSTVHKTVMEKKPRLKLYWGAGMHFKPNQQQFDFAPAISLATKKGGLYSYQHGLFSRSHQLTAQFLIKFKRKNREQKSGKKKVSTKR